MPRPPSHLQDVQLPLLHGPPDGVEPGQAGELALQPAEQVLHRGVVVVVLQLQAGLVGEGGGVVQGVPGGRRDDRGGRQQQR